LFFSKGCITFVEAKTKSMEIRIPVTKENRFRRIIELLDAIPPFNKLRPREKDVLAELYRINYENIDVPEKGRNRIVFHKDTRNIIAGKLGVSTQDVYNLTCSLRKRGLIEEDRFVEKYTKAFLVPIDEINFKFIEQ
jgi:hypothetical protein